MSGVVALSRHSAPTATQPIRAQADGKKSHRGFACVLVGSTQTCTKDADPRTRFNAPAIAMEPVPTVAAGVAPESRSPDVLAASQSPKNAHQLVSQSLPRRI